MGRYCVKRSAEMDEEFQILENMERETGLEPA